jgi:integrase
MRNLNRILKRELCAPSHATLLLAADEHFKVVSERLGHSTIRLTADTYSHVLESMQQGTTTKLERMLYGT